jgi:hypothetical protein
LLSKGLCLYHRRAFALKELFLLLLEANTIRIMLYKLLHRFNRCNSLRYRLSANATSANPDVPRLE